MHAEQSNQFVISSNFLDTSESQRDVRVRSIASVLFYLSQNIEIPKGGSSDDYEGDRYAPIQLEYHTCGQGLSDQVKQTEARAGFYCHSV